MATRRRRKKPPSGRIIDVDLEETAEAIAKALPRKGDIQRALRGIVSAARTEWVRLAKTELKSTSRDYIAGIQQPEIGPTSASIQLVGVVPNMVEHGWEGGDLRTTLLGPGAKNARTAKDGSRYNTVPFRHGTPGTSGRNVGREMPKPIHQVAKNLAPTLSRPGGGVSYGDRLMPGMKMSAAAKKILATKERPHHKSSIYQGMIREEKVYKGAKQSQYLTFRRISSRSKEGWVHPGITARHLARKVEQYVARIQGDLVRKATE